MNRADGELLVLILLGDAMVHAVWCLTEATWSSVTKRFGWSLAERISRWLALSVVRTGSSIAAQMLSRGHAEQLFAQLCVILAHLQWSLYLDKTYAVTRVI